MLRRRFPIGAAHSAASTVLAAVRAATHRSGAPSAVSSGVPVGPARTFLANTVNLLPGTLSVALEQDTLTVQALDIGTPARQETA